MKLAVRSIVSFVLSLALSGCRPCCEKLEPSITCPLPAYKISSMPSAFHSASEEEKSEPWAQELLIGNAFAKECDFYRAITSYKRALILLPPFNLERRLQIEYDICLSYYLGGKYQDAINVFEGGPLSEAQPGTLPAFNNLAILLYDSYLQLGQEDKAQCLLEIINKFSTETAEELTLYQSFKAGEIEQTEILLSQSKNPFEMEKDFAFYRQFAKSPRKAKILNALLPGAGYYYVGQKKSALTSFIINSLFIAAAYQFFHKGYPAAGAITASLEAGWYIGGINGAGIEAREFNTRLFEGVGKKILHTNSCFPVLMFETSF